MQWTLPSVQRLLNLRGPTRERAYRLMALALSDSDADAVLAQTQPFGRWQTLTPGLGGLVASFLESSDLPRLARASRCSAAWVRHPTAVHEWHSAETPPARVRPQVVQLVSDEQVPWINTRPLQKLVL